jgi:hypothetical protein
VVFGRHVTLHRNGDQSVASRFSASFFLMHSGQYQGAGALTGLGLRLRQPAHRNRFPFTAVLGRNFFPLLGKPFAIGTSVSVQSKNPWTFGLKARPPHGPHRISPLGLLPSCKHFSTVYAGGPLPGNEPTKIEQMLRPSRHRPFRIHLTALKTVPIFIHHSFSRMLPARMDYRGMACGPRAKAPSNNPNTQAPSTIPIARIGEHEPVRGLGKYPGRHRSGPGLCAPESTPA